MSQPGTADVGSVSTSQRCIIAADLHCDGSARRLAMLEELLRSCQENGADCYLLGDLFDVWLGPGQISLSQTRRELDALRHACESEIDVVVIPGNRDFLLDSSFERATGVAVGGDHLLLETGGQRWHLSHGDLFGTADRGYQRLRTVLRSNLFRFVVRHLPMFMCKGLARILRRSSRRSLEGKAQILMEPDRRVVGDLLKDGFDRVVCGHYHRPFEEKLDQSEGAGSFTVLEAFEDRGAHLFIEDGEMEVRYLE